MISSVAFYPSTDCLCIHFFGSSRQQFHAREPQRSTSEQQGKQKGRREAGLSVVDWLKAKLSTSE
jgi:hypothetical protein